MVELQELLEKQNFEVVQAKERISALAASVAELEEDLGTARKDLIKSEEMSSKYQRDLREVSPCPPALPSPGRDLTAASTGLGRDWSSCCGQGVLQKRPLPSGNCPQDTSRTFLRLQAGSQVCCTPGAVSVSSLGDSV